MHSTSLYAQPWNSFKVMVHHHDIFPPHGDNYATNVDERCTDSTLKVHSLQAVHDMSVSECTTNHCFTTASQRPSIPYSTDPGLPALACTQAPQCSGFALTRDSTRAASVRRELHWLVLGLLVHNT